jgi:hypothetical protein
MKIAVARVEPESCTRACSFVAKAKRKVFADVNLARESLRPQEKCPAASSIRHTVEKQATNFSESARIKIEAAHWPIAEHASRR